MLIAAASIPSAAIAAAVTTVTAPVVPVAAVVGMHVAGGGGVAIKARGGIAPAVPWAALLVQPDRDDGKTDQTQDKDGKHGRIRFPSARWAQPDTR